MPADGLPEIIQLRSRKLAGVAAWLLLAAFTFLFVWKLGLTVAWVGVVLVVLLCMALAKPELATLSVVFAMYANLAVVAVRFYGVPKIVAVGLFLLLVLPVLYYVSVRREPVRADGVLVLMFAYLFVQVVSAILSVSTADSLDPIGRYILEGMLLYFLVLNAIRTPEVLRRSLWAMVLAGAMLGSLSLLQSFTRTYDNQYGGLAQTRFVTAAGQLREPTLEIEDVARSGPVESRPRVMGSIGDPNYYGQILVVVLPIALLRLWAEKRKWLRGVAALAVLVLGGGILLTFSRGAGLAVVVLAFALAVFRYMKVRYLAALLAVAMIAVMLSPDYRGRMMTLIHLDSTGMRLADPSTQERVSLLLATANVFLDYPVLGVGSGQSPHYIASYSTSVGYSRSRGIKEAHNMYLTILAETGMLGFGVFTAILFMIVRRMVRLRRYWASRRPDYSHTLTGLVLAIIGFLVTGMFLHLADSRYFWLLIAMSGAAVSIYRKEMQPEEAPAQSLPLGGDRRTAGYVNRARGTKW